MVLIVVMSYVGLPNVPKGEGGRVGRVNYQFLLQRKMGTENVLTHVFCQSLYKNKIRSVAKDSEDSGISLTDRA